MIGEQGLQPQQNSQERKERPMHFIEIADGFTEERLRAILNLEDKSFPKDWQYEDGEKYYKDMLEDVSNLNLFLKEGEKIIGYLLAIPHDKVYEELKENDPLMLQDSERLYIETMEIDPVIQKTLLGGKLCFRMLEVLIQEAKNRGIHKFSMHARVSNGLSSAIQKYFRGVITDVRRIEEWTYYNNEEPVDYMLADVEKRDR